MRVHNMDRLTINVGDAPNLVVPNREVVAVEHPMVIMNTDRALKTFGTGVPLKHVRYPLVYIIIILLSFLIYG